MCVCKKDPANKDFIDSITRGEVPSEFDRAQRPGGLVKDAKPVHVNLVSKMDQQYVPPAKPKYVAFAGQGQKLRYAIRFFFSLSLFLRSYKHSTRQTFIYFGTN